ncbi:replication initiator protein [Sigmofec virus UA08Rod_5936]|uniref:Replication initiator protein n=1 Tax=Sigmofec virus UA08Rod_5936 TaxID=2929447 RepID=A0A976N1C3_9VIRU|nr:replication initiator protein [Sigmofec virus UA08Rod_5936]
MPCYHPLLRVILQKDFTADGKDAAVVASFPPTLRPGIDHRVKRLSPGSNMFTPCLDSEGYPFQTIPCGKCIGCRMEYSRQWANRCMLELEYHDSAYFVTLTYDDYHVRRSFYPDPDTGEVNLSLTLRKRDSQLFLKRLRFYRPDDKIRFFMCGEYGPSTWRPHMHFILFGLHLDDLVLVGNRRGNNYYHSELLERCWSEKTEIPGLDGKTCATPLSKIGFVEVMEVTWEACAYTARYIMKKLKGPSAAFYEQFGLEPPFVLMSRKPGIARQWYEDHPNIDEFEYINIKTERGGKKFRPPKYYVDLFEEDYPEESELFKQNRLRLTEASIRAKLERTDLSYLDYLQVEEDKFKRRISSLRREEI